MTHNFVPLSDSKACGQCGRPRISTAHDFDSIVRKPAPETAQERAARRFPAAGELICSMTPAERVRFMAPVPPEEEGRYSLCTKCGFIGDADPPHRRHPGCNYSAQEIGREARLLRAELERWKARAELEARSKVALMQERDESKQALATAREERRAADAHWSTELEKDHAKLAKANTRVAELEGSVRSLVASIAKMMAALEDELGPLIRERDRAKLRAWTVEAAALEAMLQEPTP